MDEERERALELRDYGRIAWRHRWLIILTVAIAVLTAVAYTATRESVYEATAQLIIQRGSALDVTPQNAENAARNVDTETAVLRSKVVRDAAEAKLGHDTDVSVSSSQSSDVVNVSARSRSAERAASDATAYATAYVAFRRKQNIDDLVQAGQEVQAKISALNDRIAGLAAGSPELAAAQEQLTFLQQQLDQLQVSANLDQVAGARVLAPAEVPTSPVSPKPLRNGAIALVLGLLLAICLTFLREYLDDTVTTREDLERATGGLTVLGEIPRFAGSGDSAAAQLVAVEEPHSPAAEVFRTLCASVEFLAFDRELDCIQVTSSQTDDGKTATLANLAHAFARAGVVVTVVCCDLRRPRIHEFFGLKNEVGFTSVLLGKCTAVDALQLVPAQPNLSIISSGPLAPNPAELLSSVRTDDVISSIKKTTNSGLVFVDTPPVLPVADALIVSGMVDATLLVASANSSSRRSLQRSVQMLRQVDAQLIGTVLVNADVADSDAAAEYGYSGPR